MPNAIITGASQGMGKVIAAHFLKAGFSIAVCARNLSNLEECRREWLRQYPLATVHIFQADLAKKEQADAFAAFILQHFPSADVLVNNAGSYQPGELATEPEGQLEHMIATNLYSAYWLTRRLLPAMKDSHTGHIFNICSVASLKAYPNGGAYSISKYALLGFSDNLRSELMPYNIKVTSICPGATYTPSWEGSGVDPARIMESADVARMLVSACHLSAAANVETIVMRPVKGDL